ncbi:CLUMA_CG018377, isoform A [Clunio marinus]|uniref:CLUMA_CG018377, isoform A n=1 Tax=Clunio marinus TaxID=568069 RepID=A0A1J1J0X4_9DIPT|nr:CLUMA_CG018377, isoform A [Clunio marinus]
MKQIRLELYQLPITLTLTIANAYRKMLCVSFFMQSRKVRNQEFLSQVELLYNFRSEKSLLNLSLFHFVSKCMKSNNVKQLKSGEKS